MTCKRFRLSSGFIVNLHEQSSSTARAQLEHQHRKEVVLKTYKVLRFYFIYISINPVKYQYNHKSRLSACQTRSDRRLRRRAAGRCVNMFPGRRSVNASAASARTVTHRVTHGHGDCGLSHGAGGGRLTRTEPPDSESDDHHHDDMMARPAGAAPARPHGGGLTGAAGSRESHESQWPGVTVTRRRAASVAA